MDYDKLAKEYTREEYGDDPVPFGMYCFDDITKGMVYFMRRTQFHRLLACLVSFFLGVLVGNWM